MSLKGSSKEQGSIAVKQSYLHIPPHKNVSFQEKIHQEESQWVMSWLVLDKAHIVIAGMWKQVAIYFGVNTVNHIFSSKKQK